MFENRSSDEIFFLLKYFLFRNSTSDGQRFLITKHYLIYYVQIIELLSFKRFLGVCIVMFHLTKRYPIEYFAV